MHDKPQKEILSALLQLLTNDDVVIQSWTFLCLGAIADQVVSRPSHSSAADGGLSDFWDPVWTHAMRRASVPIVCRSACHIAHIFLLHSKPLLSTQRALIEVESFAKDLDVQGPPFPYDSVCSFLALCLQVASQDMRLYRMQIEDKALAWLTDSWRLAVTRTTGGHSLDGSRVKVPHPVVADLMLLLENICGLSRRSSLVCRTILPDCAIVEQMVEERRTTVIREFLLDARLPPFQKSTEAATVSSSSQTSSTTATAPGSQFESIEAQELANPGQRERKVSSMMHKFLSSLLPDWERNDSTTAHMSAERARQLLDVAITCLTFQSLLIYNGTRSDRKVLQDACKLITHVTPLLMTRKWSAEEQAVVLLGFEPLVSAGEQEEEEPAWEGMLSPNEGTGIRREVLRGMTSSMGRDRTQMVAARRELQRIIWQTAEVRHFG